MFKSKKKHFKKNVDVSVIKLWNKINMKGKGPLNYTKLESEPRLKKKAILKDHFITCQWNNG
jgi:hypothetical protein